MPFNILPDEIHKICVVLCENVIFKMHIFSTFGLVENIQTLYMFFAVSFSQSAPAIVEGTCLLEENVEREAHASVRIGLLHSYWSGHQPRNVLF